MIAANPTTRARPSIHRLSAVRRRKERFMRIPVITLTLSLVTVALLAASAPSDAQSGCVGKIVKHALGETCVPGNAKRVAALEWAYAENLLSLGVQPLAVADIKGYNTWVGIDPKLASGVAEVGTRQAPNLELLTTLKPDLILVPSFRAAQIYPRLAQIAPTLAFDPYPQDGSSHFAEMLTTYRTIAAAVGRSSIGEAVLTRMNAGFNAARAQLVQKKLAGDSFVLAQAFTAQNTGTMRLFTRNSMASEILERIGLKNAWSDRAQQYGFTTLGLEGLTQLKTDHFFYIVQESDNVFASSSVEALWKSLEFVKNDRAYRLSDTTWTFGGPLSAQVLVNGALNALGKKP
jgi:iron complex transport system substrate-binding protein